MTPAVPMEPSPPTESCDAPNESDLPPRAVVRARQLGLTTPVRHSTPVGTIDATTVAEVDAAGMVRRRGAGWSLDWWVGAEDRWHHPSVEAAVRQELLEESPVVRTALRVPGGDVVQTVYGVRAAAPAPDGGRWDDDAVVVEVTNETSVPVALALVVRPVTLDGVGSVSEVRVDGARVLVDGEVAAVCSRPVTRVSIGHGAGDAAARLAANDDLEPGPDGVVADGDHDLEVACVVPLPHTATVRILVPAARQVGSKRRSSDPVPGPGAGWQAPEVDSVVAGWQAHSRSSTSLDVPEPLHGGVVVAGGRVLTLAAGAGLHDGDGELAVATRAAQLTELLVRIGVAEPLEPLLAAFLEARRLGGSVRFGDRSDATVAMVHVAGALIERATTASHAEELLALLDAALRRVERRPDTRPDAATGRSAGIAAAHVVPTLRRLGQHGLADAAGELADELLRGGAAPLAAPPGEGATPAGSTTAVGLAARSALLAGSGADVAPLLLPLLRSGSPGVIGDRIDGEGRSSGRRGLDAPAIATRVAAALDSVVIETRGGLDLLAGWSPSWYGAPVEVHRVRTAHGVVSFALRWHGTRPALLWEVLAAEGADPDRPPVLRAPVLDSSWSGTAWQGEALLGEVAPPESMVSLRGARGTVPNPTATDQGSTAAGPDEGESFS